jgi:hypothetical protein
MMVACCGCSDDWAVIDTDKLADRLGGAPLRESLIAHFLGYPSHFICLAGLFDEIPKFLFCGVSRPLIFVACADKARQISFGLDPCICVVVDADDERCARTGLLFRPAVSNIYRAPVARRSRRADRIRHGTAQAPCRLAHRRKSRLAILMRRVARHPPGAWAACLSQSNHGRRCLNSASASGPALEAALRPRRPARLRLG